MSSSSRGTDIVPPTPSPVRMNGHKARAPSPAESLCSVQCEATEPLQAGARKRIRDAPDCGSAGREYQCLVLIFCLEPGLCSL